MTSITQGEDKTILVTIKKGGVPLDLTGLTAAALKFAITSGVLTKTLGAGISVFGAATNGQLKVIVTQAETVNLVAGDSVMELILDFGSIRTIKNIRNACIVRQQRF